MITIKRITIEDFQALAVKWDAFLKESTNNTLFLTCEWLSSWWRAFENESRTFYFLIAYDSQDNIVGGFPLQLITKKQRLYSLKLLITIGRGGLGFEESEYNTFMMPPTLTGFEGEVCRAIIDFLDAHGEEWDLMFLANLLSTHTTTSILYTELQKNFKVKRVKQANNYVIKLAETYDVFVKKLSRNKRRLIKKRTNKAHRNYDVKFALTTKEDEIEGYLKDYHSLVEQRHSWTPSPAREAFIRTMCLTFAQREWLKNYTLLFNNEPVATVLGFLYNQKYYAYKAAINPMFSSDSPGTILYAHIFQTEIDQGTTELDFLIGEYEYKQYWCNEVRKIDYLQIDSKTIISRLLVRLSFISVVISQSIGRVKAFINKKLGRN